VGSFFVRRFTERSWGRYLKQRFFVIMTQYRWQSVHAAVSADYAKYALPGYNALLLEDTPIYLGRIHPGS
jgi:hypothetical protein